MNTVNILTKTIKGQVQNFSSLSENITDIPICTLKALIVVAIFPSLCGGGKKFISKANPMGAKINSPHTV